jgi:hypothetical protein
MVVAGRCQLSSIRPMSSAATDPVLEGNAIAQSPFRICQVCRLKRAASTPFQIKRVETLSRPAVEQSEKLACLSRLAMIAPELATLTITEELPLGRALHHDRAIPQPLK